MKPSLKQSHGLLETMPFSAEPPEMRLKGRLVARDCLEFSLVSSEESPKFGFGGSELRFRNISLAVKAT